MKWHREGDIIYILLTILLRLIKQDCLDRNNLEMKAKEPCRKLLVLKREKNHLRVLYTEKRINTVDKKR
jgi:hypothetical protein